MYEYRCKILKVVDGDTVDIDIDLGFGVWLHNERIRLAGIDTPESRTRDLTEKQFGLYATQYVEAKMPVGSSQILRTTEYDPRGKFGRVLGDFVIDGVSLVDTMIAEHIGVAYDGQSKEDIEAAHLENRTLLLESGVVLPSID